MPELEPGEAEDFGTDFFVSATTETVYAYAYLSNVKKRRGKRNLGWTLTEYRDIGETD